MSCHHNQYRPFFVTSATFFIGHLDLVTISKPACQIHTSGIHWASCPATSCMESRLVQPLYRLYFWGKLCAKLLIPIGIQGGLQRSTSLVLAQQECDSCTWQCHFVKVSMAPLFVVLCLVTNTSLLGFHSRTLVHSQFIYCVVASCVFLGMLGSLWPFVQLDLLFLGIWLLYVLSHCQSSRRSIGVRLLMRCHTFPKHLYE